MSDSDSTGKKVSSVFDGFVDHEHRTIPMGAKDTTFGLWKLPELSKVDQKGKVRLWQVGFIEESATMIIVHGLSTSLKADRRQVQPKSTRTLQQQALQECNNRYTKMIRKSYVKSDGSSTSIPSSKPKCGNKLPKKSSTKFKIQLANKYRNAKSSNIYGFPVIAQPKLDGIRAYASIIDGKIKLKSRTHIDFPWLDHIKVDALDIIKRSNVDGVVLDGELYVHGECFQNLSSIIRTRKTKHELNDVIRFNVFDVYTTTEISSEKRHELLNELHSKAKPKSIDIVPCKIVPDHDGLDRYHDECARQGYEGIVIRQIASSIPSKKACFAYYRGGRNNALLKYKKFSEEEGTIIDVSQGTGREKGKAMFTVKDPRGNVLKMRPEGNFEKREDIYQNREKYVGATVTYSFQTLSTDGVPIFAVAKDIRNYES